MITLMQSLKGHPNQSEFGGFQYLVSHWLALIEPYEEFLTGSVGHATRIREPRDQHKSFWVNNNVEAE